MGIMDAVLERIVSVRMRSAGYDQRMVAFHREAAMAVRPDPAAYAVSHEKLWDEAGKPILDAIVSGVRPSPLVFDQAQIDVLSPPPGTGEGQIARLKNSVSEKDGRRRAVLVALSRLMDSEPEVIEDRIRGAFPSEVASAVLPTILETRAFRAEHGRASAGWILASRRLRTAEVVLGRVANGSIATDWGIVVLGVVSSASIAQVEDIGRRLRKGDAFDHVEALRDSRSPYATAEEEMSAEQEGPASRF